MNKQITRYKEENRFQIYSSVASFMQLQLKKEQQPMFRFAIAILKLAIDNQQAAILREIKPK